MMYTCSYLKHLIYLYMTENNFFPTNLQWTIKIEIDFKSFHGKAISGIYIPHNQQITANFVIYLMAGDYTGDTLWDFGNIYQKTKKSK